LSTSSTTLFAYPSKPPETPPADTLGGVIDVAPFNTALLSWYDERGRTLDVRSTTDAWAILVAEVMSQQTQIERIALPWRAFLSRWPSPGALATATPSDVVRAWAGLGYNRRALALLDAARAIVVRHGGQVPPDIADLEALPGVGPYTARAVAATAFGIPVAAVDVNVGRVVGRVTGCSTARRELQREADRLVDPCASRSWTFAMMDLAATVCRTRDPLCTGCPVAVQCAGRSAVTSNATRGKAQPRFPATRRWLRGRIVDRLRTADGWVTFDAPIGEHDANAVVDALRRLAADGLVELEPDLAGAPKRARLPRYRDAA
jgi:A/G-specific adenine glycosylase